MVLLDEVYRVLTGEIERIFENTLDRGSASLPQGDAAGTSRFEPGRCCVSGDRYSTFDNFLQITTGRYNRLRL
jgi:hypothetical protein